MLIAQANRRNNKMADHVSPEIRQLLDKIKKDSTEKQRRLLDDLDRKLANTVPVEDSHVMRVESTVASETKNPEVVFLWGANKGQLDVITARNYALQIIEACEAAVQDASLYRAISNSQKDGDPEKTDTMAFQLINLVREERRHFEQ
jgi:hypothetical protein